VPDPSLESLQDKHSGKDDVEGPEIPGVNGTDRQDIDVEKAHEKPDGEDDRGKRAHQFPPGEISISLICSSFFSTL